jgi:hypothetical protein
MGKHRLVEQGLKKTFFISQFLKQFSYVGVPEGASAGGIEFTM